ncbi:MAG: hypothetical protein JWM19_5719 [Actinomycetia bacterium]|nr:hypothetical protein [Actinomycetes bacterium]
MLVVGTPDERLRLLPALASRRKGSVAAGIPGAFAGYLMTDGYTGYQHLLSRIAGIGQCGQWRKPGPAAAPDSTRRSLTTCGNAMTPP